jgi:predicted nucleotidyltransferase
MNSADYDSFTRELTARLAADARVVGLVALGSMARRDYAPDEWSDHDFFVVTLPGNQEELRSDLAWLPRAAEVALSFRETDHGLKVLYEDGHLLEFAVFDLHELRLSRINRYRVLFDRGAVAARIEEVARATADSSSGSDDDPTVSFGMLLTNVLVGAGRHARGEALSGSFFIKSLAARWLLVLVERTLPSERSSVLDDLDPFRRFELAYPVVGREIEVLLSSGTLAAARGLLDLAERELRPHLPDLPWPALELVRAKVEGLAGSKG